MHTTPVADRFWPKVTITDDCWLWNASVNNKGYGHIHLGHRNGHRYAHRVSWELNVGPIPRGLMVLHKCDTPRCVKPEHLFVGTQLDNMRDAKSKGRAPILARGSGAKGESHGMSKLTRSDIETIRVSSLSRTELAKEFHIDPRYVWAIKTRRTWRHIP